MDWRRIIVDNGEGGAVQVRGNRIGTVPLNDPGKALIAFHAAIVGDADGRGAHAGTEVHCSVDDPGIVTVVGVALVGEG